MTTLLESVDTFLSERAKRLKIRRGLFDTGLQRGAWQARFATGLAREERELER